MNLVVIVDKAVTAADLNQAVWNELLKTAESLAERLNRAEKRNAEFEAIFAALPLQEIGAELGLPWGATISVEILPGIQNLNARIAVLEREAALAEGEGKQ